MNKRSTLSLIVGVLMLINALAVIGTWLVYSQKVNSITYSNQALNLAKAGVDKAVASLNSTSGNYTGEDETKLGPGSYSVQISPKNSTTDIVTASGYVPDKSTLFAQVTVVAEVAIKAGNISGANTYSIVPETYRVK